VVAEPRDAEGAEAGLPGLLPHLPRNRGREQPHGCAGQHPEEGSPAQCNLEGIHRRDAPGLTCPLLLASARYPGGVTADSGEPPLVVILDPSGCHPERSEGSQRLTGLRFLAALGMTDCSPVVR